MEIINLPLLVPERVIDSALWLSDRNVNIDVLISSLSEFYYITMRNGFSVGSDVYDITLGVAFDPTVSILEVGSADIGMNLMHFVSPDARLCMGVSAGLAQQFSLKIKNGLDMGNASLSLGYVKYTSMSGGFAVGATVEMNVTSPITATPSALCISSVGSMEMRLYKSFPVKSGVDVGTRCKCNTDVWADLSANGLCLYSTPSISLILYARLLDYDADNMDAIDDRTLEDLDILD